MIHRSWRRHLMLPAALLCVPAWLAACAPDETTTAAPSKTVSKSASPTKPPATSTATTNATPAPAFEECDLLTPEDLEQAFRKPGWLKTMHSAQPHETGWRVRCVYGHSDPGTPGITVGVETGRPPGWAGKPFGRTKDADGKPLLLAEPQPIPDLGDEAWSSLLYAKLRERETYVPRASVATIRKGSTNIWVSMDIVEDANPMDLARIPEELGQVATDRIGDPVEVVAETATGGCGDISLAAASKFSRMRLVSSRSVEPEDSQLNCLLGGREGFLWIALNESPEGVQSWRDNAEKGQPITGLGKEAYQFGSTTVVMIGKRALTVAIAPDDQDTYFKESGWTEKPTKEGMAFLRTVVSSFA